jgi:nucleoside-diphosphate-sugar epimerase
MSRILVTGASGFIGRQALPILVSNGHEVHAVSAGRTLPLPGVIWHSTDLLDREQSAALLDDVRPSHLLHFAWYAEHGKFWNSPLNLDWAAASIRLFQSFVEIGGRRAVFAGTCGEYEWAGSGMLVEENSPSRPGTLYGVCKNATREIVQSYARQTGVSTAWGRIFFLYGPHEQANRLVPSILQPLASGNSACVRCGDHVRDLLHVQDVASAFVNLLESDVTGVVNIASGLGVRLGDVARQIATILGRTDLLDVGSQPSTSENPGVLIGDNRRLKNEVGWRPRYTLKQGLEHTLESMRAPYSGRRPDLERSLAGDVSAFD